MLFLSDAVRLEHVFELMRIMLGKLVDFALQTLKTYSDPVLEKRHILSVWIYRSILQWMDQIAKMAT